MLLWLGQSRGFLEGIHEVDKKVKGFPKLRKFDMGYWKWEKNSGVSFVEAAYECLPRNEKI